MTYIYTCVSLTHAQSRRSAPELRYTTRPRVYVRDDRICSYDTRNQRTMPFHLSVLTLKIRLGIMFLRELLMLILTVCVNCQPTLEPPTGHFCPEVNVTYTCHDSLVTTMTWFAEPYFSANQGIKYAPGFTTDETMKKGGYFYSKATNFSVDMEEKTFLSVTTTLTVITSGLENGTNITCLTTRGGGLKLVSSSILYFAGNGN